MLAPNRKDPGRLAPCRGLLIAFGGRWARLAYSVLGTGRCRSAVGAAAAAGARFRSASSSMLAAAIAAITAAPTPIQNVDATPRLNAWWIPATMFVMYGSTAGRTAAGTEARIAGPRSPTAVSW